MLRSDAHEPEVPSGSCLVNYVVSPIEISHLLFSPLHGSYSIYLFSNCNITLTQHYCSAATTSNFTRRLVGYISSLDKSTSRVFRKGNNLTMHKKFLEKNLPVALHNES